jgi:hypothetical protein
MPFNEVRSLHSGSTILVLDKNGNYRKVRITSVKLWKTKSMNCEIHCKYGLYEYFIISYVNGVARFPIMKEVEL